MEGIAATGNTIFIDVTNTRVGVKKNNPTTTLDVNGTVTAPAFVGVLTGSSTLNVLKAGDTMTGNLIVANSSVAVTGTGIFQGSGAGITSLVAANISAGSLGGSVMASSLAISGFWNSATIRANLGLAIGTGVQAWDADLDDLADGSLTGSKVGSGVPAANIAAGSLGGSVIASSVAVDAVTNPSIVSVASTKLTGTIPAGLVDLSTVTTRFITLETSTGTIKASLDSVILSTGVINARVDAVILSTGIIDAAKVNRAGDTMTGSLNMGNNFLTGISTITMHDGTIAIVPPGTAGSNSVYGISIGSNTYNNYTYGVGVGHSAYDNYDHGVGVGRAAFYNNNYGVGVGYYASSNYTYGVGVGNAAYGNYNSGVGIGNAAYENYNSGVGVGHNAYSNYSYGVGVGNNAYSNHTGGVGVGYYASNNYTSGVGVGYNTHSNHTSGVGVGYNAYNNYTSGVGIGANSQNNYNYGTGVGAYTTASSSSVALGSHAKAPAKESLALGAGTVNHSTGTASFGVYAITTSSNVTASAFYGSSMGFNDGTILKTAISTASISMSIAGDLYISSLTPTGLGCYLLMGSTITITEVQSYVVYSATYTNIIADLHVVSAGSHISIWDTNQAARPSIPANSNYSAVVSTFATGASYTIPKGKVLSLHIDQVGNTGDVGALPGTDFGIYIKYYKNPGQ